jgi:hypothetical protein
MLGTVEEPRRTTQDGAVKSPRGRRTVPQHIYDLLRAGFLEAEADWLVARYPDYAANDLVYPGDPFVRVLTWLWRDDPPLAMDFLAGYLARLRMWSPLLTPDRPRIRFTDLLDSLFVVPPAGFTRAEADQLVAAARREVPKYFGDVNLDTTGPTLIRRDVAVPTQARDSVPASRTSAA